MDEPNPSDSAALVMEVHMGASVSYRELSSALDSGDPPLLIDVRRRAAFTSARELAAGALRRDPESVSEWAGMLPQAGGIVVYCVHGHEVSQGVASALRARGLEARYLEGGLEEGWRPHGGLDTKPAGASTRWVTRARPKIDRIACPWLVSRFVDREAQFLYVPADRVLEVARHEEAVAYDVPGVAFGHDGALCSFDAFLRHYRLHDPALARLAAIVRGADTGVLDLAPECAGLLAVSHGLSSLYADDHVMLQQGMAVYDALHAWCRNASS